MSNDFIPSPSPSSQTEAEFVERFGAVYEYSPWVAARTWAGGLTAAQDTVDGLAAAMAEVLDNHASRQEQLMLIKAHPDLAGKAAARGELTDESDSEQASAGLDQCSAAELQQFHTDNDAYKAKFEFPFIMAVRGSNRFEILAAFAQRLNNDDATEFAQALKEINKIARLRLAALSDRAGD